MKKIVFLLCALTLSIASCKKEKKDAASTPQTYEDRVAGNWDLVAVSYETEIPDLSGSGGGPISIAGEGKDVSGTFILTKNPNEINYILSFNAELDPLNTGNPVEFPVNFASSGVWTTTSDASKLIVTDDNGEEILFNVEVNEQNKQVFSSTLSQSINVGIPITLEVDIVLTFERGN